MRVLVLGGTRFVGRCIVEEALRRGHQVTTVNRGASGADRPEVEALHADRREDGALAAALGDGTWDAVLDTWSFEPVVVRESAQLLADRAGHYGYVSSESVYEWPNSPGFDESAPVVEADPGSTDPGDYAAAKRGGELAVLESFEGRSLIARAGLILGPYENIGRLPWWLGRIARGGRVPAPGPHDRPLQYIDARDLAGWMLDVAERGVSGAFNTVAPSGHTTIGELLELAVRVVGSDAELVWLTPEVVEAAGVSGWTDLPIWAPPTGELASLHGSDVSAAHAAGLTCRPVEETVTAAWRWLQEEGFPEPRPGIGLSADLEAKLWATQAQAS